MDTAFEILAAQYRPMLLCYARALMQGHEQDAEDVVQEALLTAHQRLETFRKDENFGRWLRGIVRNKALESHRAARRRAIVDSRILEGIEDVYILFDIPSLTEEPWQERIRRLLRRCVDRLSPPLHEAVVRVYQNGLSLRETAAACNATPAAVGQRLSRARELLRTCVREHAESES